MIHSVPYPVLNIYLLKIFHKKNNFNDKMWLDADNLLTSQIIFLQNLVISRFHVFVITQFQLN